MSLDNVYTQTILQAARRHGVKVRVLDENLPIFELSKGGKKIRCWNALTDRVGAATFFLANDKQSAHQFLSARGIPVPAQVLFSTLPAAETFLRRWRTVVVKPRMEWGGRGVGMCIRTPAELRRAVRRARTFGAEVLLEQCVAGVDLRLIFVQHRLVAAIRREPARVTGNGRDSVRRLIRAKNRAARKMDPDCIVPMDHETVRAVRAAGYALTDVPPAGRGVRVRHNSNVHTGGLAAVVTRDVDRRLAAAGRKISRAVGALILGVDFLVEPQTGRFRVLELSPDIGLSPPEGGVAAAALIRALFGKSA